MISGNKIVQVPVDADLLAALDELSRSGGESRSALIRRACRDYIQKVRQEALDDVYERGYRRIREDSALGEAQASVAAQTLTKESW